MLAIPTTNTILPPSPPRFTVTHSAAGHELRDGDQGDKIVARFTSFDRAMQEMRRRNAAHQARTGYPATIKREG